MAIKQLIGEILSELGLVKEMKQKAKALKRAFSIVFREYRSKQLRGAGRGTVTRVLEKIFDSKIRSKVDVFRIVKYNVRGPKNGKK